MATTFSARSWTGRLRESEIKSLWLVFPPILVMLLAGLIFEFSAFDLVGLSGQLDALLRGAPERDTAAILGESRARLLWSTAVLLSTFTGLALVIAAIAVMRRCLAGVALRLYLLLGLVLAAVNTLQLLLGGMMESGTSAIFSFTYDSLVRSGQFEADRLLALRVVMYGLNGLSAIAPSLAFLAACSTLVEAPGGTSDLLDHLKARMRGLKMLLNLGSALLVVGVLHMTAWLRWPAVLVAEPAVAAEIEGLALAITLFWGAAFTLLIVAFYVPASFILGRRAEAAIAAAPEKAGGLEVEEWLKRHGLSIAPTQQLPQMAVMLAPLLAGPLGSALGAFSNPLAG